MSNNYVYTDTNDSTSRVLQKGDEQGRLEVGGTVGLTADARTGKLTSGLWTLGSTATVETIAIPDWARGFRLRPSADVRFAINEDPAVAGSETLAVGATAFASEWETRLLESVTGRILHLRTLANGTTVHCGFF